MGDPHAHKKRFCTYCRYKTFRLPPKPHICSGCGKEYQTVIDTKHESTDPSQKQQTGLDAWK